MPTILVTGASRGLGLEFVRQYTEDGWQVIACCRSPGSADELQSLAAINNNITIEKLDVQNHAESKRWLKSMLSSRSMCC